MPTTTSPKRETAVFHKTTGFSAAVSKAKKLRGTLFAPPSKSYTHRAVIVACMNGSSILHNPLRAADTLATMEAWRAFGCIIKDDVPANRLHVSGFDGRPRFSDGTKIDIGESGSLLRFALPVACLGTGDLEFVGRGTSLRRANSMVVEPLRALGVQIEAEGADCRLPIKVHGAGRLSGGRVHVRGNQSSQVVTAFLLVAPLCEGGMVVQVDGELVSKPYVDITIDVMERAGIRVTRDGYRSFLVPEGQCYQSLGEFHINGDYSAAAFFMAAAACVPADITIEGLVEDKQGDRRIVDILSEMGADIRCAENRIIVQGPSRLKGIDVSCRDVPDLVPAIASVAAVSEGKTRIFDIAHLRLKESDRIASLVKEFSKLGVRIESEGDMISIEGSRVGPGTVSSCADHRIAMALSVLGLVVGGVVIEGAHCVSKSNPKFFKDLARLGAQIECVPNK